MASSTMPGMPVVGAETRVAVPVDLQEVIDALLAVERDADRIVAPLDDCLLYTSDAADD